MTELTNESDGDLLRRSAAGDQDAFTVLYRRRHVGVYRFTLQMTGSAAIAEEVTQEVFLILIREIERYDPARGSVAAWLFGVARNLVLRSLKRDRTYVAMDEETSDIAAETENPFGELSRTQTIEAVRQAVLSLPPVYREPVVLCDLEEMSYADAAQAMSVPIGTVRSRLNRGRALLVEKLRGRGAGVNPAKGLSSMRCSHGLV